MLMMSKKKKFCVPFLSTLTTYFYLPPNSYNLFFFNPHVISLVLNLIKLLHNPNLTHIKNYKSKLSFTLDSTVLGSSLLSAKGICVSANLHLTKETQLPLSHPCLPSLTLPPNLSLLHSWQVGKRERCVA